MKQIHRAYDFNYTLLSWSRYGLSSSCYILEKCDHDLVVKYLNKHPWERAKWFFHRWKNGVPEYSKVLEMAEREEK